MTRALWIPDRLEAQGLTVIREWGWDLRGDDTLNPHGIVCHHTASNPPANAPSVGICINGRPDLPGPLCQLLIARDGTCHVIASGTANHAGQGGWKGLTGNTQVLGIEVENNGQGEPWTDHLLDVFARACAALCEGGGIPVANVCLHREWAPTRKIDPAGPGFPQDGNTWRQRVQAALDNEGTFGTMDDKQVLDEFANVTKRTGAQLDALADELKAQAKRHNEAARDRDTKLLDVLERIATKLDA